MDIASLVFAVYSGRGIYVPLLGSGVSRGAGIPTGYEVMLDLIQQLALTLRENAAPNGEAWYQDRYGERPTYSNVVARLGLTSANRAQLLRRYFEPSELDRERGLKVPTRAHRALAQLAGRGYIRVVVTTNLDSLIETAMREAGLAPLVVSTADQVEGMLPLEHLDLVLVKLNGDYVDTRMKNIVDELTEYDPRVETLLERILEEHGLIVCGWSGQYDIGLRKAVERSKSRRFANYWAHRDALTAEATALVCLRGAHAIKIEDADAFLGDLAESVLALEAAGTRIDRSTEIQVARLKRYLPDAGRRIDLEEIVAGEARSAARACGSLDFGLDHPEPSRETAAPRVVAYEAAVKSLLPLLLCGAYWGVGGVLPIWIAAIDRLMPSPSPGAPYEFWAHLRYYPALLSLYAAGLGAVAGQQYATVTGLLRAGRVAEHGREVPWIWRLHQEFASSDGFRGLPGLENKKVPISERLFAVIGAEMDRIMVEPSRYEDVFDEWELVLALAHSDLRHGAGEAFWAPMGRFSWRLGGDGQAGVLARLKHRLEERKGLWEYLEGALFGGDPARALDALVALEQQRQVTRM